MFSSFSFLFRNNCQLLSYQYKYVLSKSYYNFICFARYSKVSLRYKKIYELRNIQAIFKSRMSSNESDEPSNFASEKRKYLEMAKEEKRKLYLVKNFVELKDVKTWKQYYEENKSKLQQKLINNASLVNNIKISPVHDQKLNEKVSLWKGDITHLEIDAIVNAANRALLGGGGVDGAIHRAAGPLLKSECRTLRGCKDGDAKITGGYNLPAKYVIHTVGPRGEQPVLLKSCYDVSLRLMLENNLRSVAFPCISTGVYGYPQSSAAHVALNTVKAFLNENYSDVDRIIFTLFLDEDVEIYETLMQSYFPINNE